MISGYVIISMTIIVLAAPTSFSYPNEKNESKIAVKITTKAICN
jgi:hypothetical protein